MSTSRPAPPRRGPLAWSTALAWVGLGLASGCGGPSVGAPATSGPITAPAETWSWVAFADARCADGTPTGLGVNLTTRSDDVVVYFEGGGACWSELTCFTLPAAVHITGGYGPSTLAAERLDLAAPFDRGAAANPFKDASYVFVPYCTGDLHAGTAVNAFGAHVAYQVGGRNVGAYLARLAETFPGARRIYVTGSSAGGYGAQLNYPRFAAAFPQAELHLLADSAQAVQPRGDLYATWLAAWQPVLPAGCAACATDLTALPAWLSASYPQGRFALLAYEQDEILAGYLGYPTTPAFQAATDALLLAAYPATPGGNARYFALGGTKHTMLADYATLATSGGVTLPGWLSRWYGGTGWVSAGP